jgi:hypothetical protein
MFPRAPADVWVMDNRIPGHLNGLIIEWKARKYRDPIRKLAYLRRATNPAPSFLWKPIHIAWYWKLTAVILVLLAVKTQTITETSADFPRPHLSPAKSGAATESTPAGEIWMVENAGDYEVYSNGLRLENHYRTSTEPRSYVVFRDGAQPENPAERRTEPAGIVFHTSESRQLPLNAGQNPALTRIGRDLLEYVSRNKAYHFVVDRFGRVFRIVAETDVANHAGYSVWADSQGTYLNLNHSFLGVSFEAETRTLDEGRYLSPAQVHAGRLLVQLLVDRYKIAPANCVTHAQVSVDPQTMIIGDHVDGAGDFPFQELGLPDNSLLPIPSLYAFGFEYDSRYMMAAGPRMLKGLILADERFRREAGVRQLSAVQYRNQLRDKYRTDIATLKRLGIIKEK